MESLSENTEMPMAISSIANTYILIFCLGRHGSCLTPGGWYAACEDMYGFSEAVPLKESPACDNILSFRVSQSTICFVEAISDFTDNGFTRSGIFCKYGVIDSLGPKLAWTNYSVVGILLVDTTVGISLRCNDVDLRLGALYRSREVGAAKGRHLGIVPANHSWRQAGNDFCTMENLISPYLSTPNHQQSYVEFLDVL